eukprot:SAG31_NODE_4823_length_2927_cov_3403.860679_5_plen_68_part_00
MLQAPDGSPILFWYAGKLDGNAIAADVTEAELKTFYVYWMELGLQKQVFALPSATLLIHRSYVQLSL